MTELATLLRAARRRAGMSQQSLARAAGTSQPTLAAYEAGRLVPRLDTLERLLRSSGHRLEISATPVVRRGAGAASEVSEDVRRLLDTEGQQSAWRRILDFVDDFRGSPRAGQAWLVGRAPRLCGEPRLDAALAGVVELLCGEAGLSEPPWVHERARFVEPWWFVAGLPGFEAMALRDSPVELKRHGVFVTEGAFERV